jgi:hypothetical protein
MPSTYTLNNGIELIGTGEQSGTWGDTTNTNLDLLDAALDGQVTITLGAAGSSGSPNALPITDGTASNGRNRMVVFADGADLGATAYVQLTPNDAEKIIYIRNSLSGSRSVILFQGTYNASNDYEVPAGTTAVVYFDGAGAGAVAANVFNNAYFDGLRLGSVSVTAILDEDNMASDSAAALATQQSIKAYVDSQVGTVDTLAEILAIGNTTGATDIAVDSAQKVQFRDAAIYINSSVDGQLDIVADTEIQIAATTVDLNGALDVSGTALVTGVLTTTAATVSNGGGQFNGAINVGVDDTGYDVKFFGATAGAYMLWDESADDLILGGAAGLSVNSTALVTGVLTTTAATVFNGGFAANVGSTITTADNTSQLTLISTDADASGGPVLDFFRNSASPADGDDTGQIRLQGKNDAGETISYVSMGSQIADMTDGTEDGKFYINTVLGGSNVSRIYMTDTETIFNDSASDLDFRVESATTANALFVEGSSGNVGIGITPSAKLDASGTYRMQLRTDDAIPELRSITANGAAFKELGLNGLDLRFYTSSTERMRIDSSGNVGIGVVPTTDHNPVVEALQIGSTANLYGRSDAETTILSSNSYLSLAGYPKYITTNEASEYTQASGNHVWYNAPSGTAGASCTLTERMRIDSSGNVGIGTTSPASYGKFVVRGSGNLVNFDATSGPVYVAFKENTTNRFFLATLNGSDGLAFVDADGSSERMRIDSSGNVGIGTSSPATPLDVTVAGGGNYIATFQNTTSATPYGVFIKDAASGAAGYPLLAVTDSAGTTSHLRVDSSTGNVGIGTSSPTAKLTVNDANDIPIRIGDISAAPVSQTAVYVGTSTSALSGLNGDLVLIPRTSDTGSILFYTGNGTAAERMRIDSSGGLRVGLSTNIFNAASAEKLSVKNTGVGAAVTFESTDVTGGYPIMYIRSTDIAASQTAVYFYRTNTVIGSISTTASSTAYNTSSDYRLKTDAQPMVGASDRVLALKPVNFEWISSGERVDGFLAHEAQAVVPECVTGTKDGMEDYEITPAVLDDDGNVTTEAVMGTRPVMQGIDQSKLVPLLTAALQEALTEISALKARVTALEG